MTDLATLQQAIAEVRSQRGFTNDPLRIFTLLNEEIGEVAGELKKSWSPNYGPPDTAKLAEELVDCLVALCALASSKDIDLEAGLEEKFFGKGTNRKWASAVNPIVDE
ncbi:MAG: MazG nucleotide pyrophosphohydrolase domain-containing protein [Acidimicrobiia bacterium]